MHDDVGDVAVHEHLARRQPDDLVRRNAAVRAADPQVLGRLSLDERGKELGVLGEVAAAQARFRSKSSSRPAIVERLSSDASRRATC